MSLIFYFFSQFLLFIALKKNYLNKKLLIIVSFSLWAGLLFDNNHVYETFPDQSKFLDNALAIRNFDFDKIFNSNFDFETTFVSLFFALMPVSLSSYSDIALINKLILFSTLIYLMHNKFISSLGFSLFLIIPSIFVYSSIALKESFIISMVFLNIYFFFHKKYFFFILNIIIIFCSRGFVGIHLIFFYLGFILFFYEYRYKNKIIYSLFLLILFLIILFQYEIAEHVNKIRYGYFLEVYGFKIINGEINYLYNNFTWSNAPYIVFNVFSKLISPVPNSLTNLNYWGLFIENTILFIVVIYFFVEQFSKNPLIALYNIIFYFYITSVISIIVFNESTFSRYRLAFTIFYILFANINFKKIKNENFTFNK